MDQTEKKQRVIQVVPAWTTGDAVGNEVAAMDEALRGAGYDTMVYAFNIGARIPSDRVRKVQELGQLDRDDVIIYHACTECDIAVKVLDQDCKKILVYHNVTPPSFFKRYDIISSHACQLGLDQIRSLSNKVDRCIADSAWNKHDLIEMGYTCPIDVIPVMIPFEDYQLEPDKDVLRKYREMPGANILFTGRVAPNKCQHDVIRAFYYYKRDYDPDARLFIVGGFSLTDVYYDSLLAYIDEIGVKDVIFPGHISFAAILAYYTLADVFLCQSEHEGFCVPLVEAMLFDTPIVAYGSTAVPETLGAGGVLLDTKDPLVTAGVMDRVVRDEDLRCSIREGQKTKLAELDYGNLQDKFLEYVKNIVEG